VASQSKPGETAGLTGATRFRERGGHDATRVRRAAPKKHEPPARARPPDS